MKTALQATTNVAGRACPVGLRSRLAPVVSGRRLWSQPKITVHAKSESDVEEGTIGEFCAIDESGKRIKGNRTVGEMEQQFLEALSSWYFEGKATLSDAEFTALKDELVWSGSKVAVLDSDELMFLEASMAYARGTPIMNDEDFNALKAELKSKSSVVAAEGPRCSIRSKKMYSDSTPDYFRMLAINIPATLVVLSVVYLFDQVTGFQLTQAIELPPPYGVALLWGLLLPTTFVLATSITNVFFRDNLVLKGPCPECGTENFTYFGEVMTVSGNRGQNVCDCVNCGAGLTFDENKRIIVVNETAEEKKKKAAALAAKKAASAAKKKAKVASA